VVAIHVCLEVGEKRIVAAAIDWPGWCRSGKTEELALGALQNYRARYAAVPEQAGVAIPGEAAMRLEVTERVPGSATTDFGAPGVVAAADRRPLDTEQARRLAALLMAAWALLDRVIARAPAELRKGPRGGGRDRDAIAAHVLSAEVAYARKLGVKHREPAVGATAAITDLREAIAAAITGSPEAAPEATGWPPRYAARRIAWHVLDHTWEIEDRTAPAADGPE